jgi:hypothetical protein
VEDMTGNTSPNDARIENKAYWCQKCGTMLSELAIEAAETFCGVCRYEQGLSP